MKVLENSTGNSCAIDHQVGAYRISAAVTLTSQLGFHCNSATLTFETLMCKESPCMWQLLCKKAANDRKLREKKTQSGICVWINKIDRQIKLHRCFFCWVFSFFSFQAIKLLRIMILSEKSDRKNDQYIGIHFVFWKQWTFISAHKLEIFM